MIQKGDPELLERFEDKIMYEPNTGCWLWTATTNSNGYGLIRAGKMVMAHRASYQLYVGPIPEGKGYHGTCVLHHCDQRLCVNPDHLWLGTNAENIWDMHRKGRGHKNGSPGEANGQAKLREEQVLAIRIDPRCHSAIAKDFGVSSSLVCMVKQRKRWAHV